MFEVEQSRKQPGIFRNSSQDYEKAFDKFITVTAAADMMPDSAMPDATSGV